MAETDDKPSRAEPLENPYMGWRVEIEGGKTGTIGSRILDREHGSLYYVHIDGTRSGVYVAEKDIHAAARKPSSGAVEATIRNHQQSAAAGDVRSAAAKPAVPQPGGDYDAAVRSHLHRILGKGEEETPPEKPAETQPATDYDAMVRSYLHATINGTKPSSPANEKPAAPAPADDYDAAVQSYVHREIERQCAGR
jgi:hypothetical protein